MNDELTPKQRMFCKAYLAEDFNGTKAALIAGASEANAANWATETLKKPEIQEYIKKLMEQIERKFEITFEEKAQMLWECVKDCKEGRATKQGYVNASGLVGAIAELNKMQGHYKEKAEVEDKLDDMQAKLNELIEHNKKDY